MSETRNHITIVEVSPRDGLQSDPTMLSTRDKVSLITRAVRSGIRRIEVVSFVNPVRVPQMADAEAVMEALHADESRSLGAAYIGLVLNERGLDRAVDCGVDEVNAVVVATDTFANKNQGRDTAGLIEAAGAVVERARSAGLGTSVTIAASFGCPYEGEVSIDRLHEVVSNVAELAPEEIALADSIGVASPLDVEQRVACAREVIGARPIQLRCHFHNTRNTGIANAVSAIRSGVTVLDASMGGIGGCPFAPNATGNIPTEDLIYMIHRMGYTTGIDLEGLASHSPWLEEVLGHSIPGYYAKAGPFPPS